MARYSNFSEITPQNAPPTRAQCFSVGTDLEHLIIAAQIVNDTGLGITHLIWGYLNETAPTDTPIVLLGIYQNLETVSTVTKYRYSFPFPAGLDISEIGIQQVIGSGAITSQTITAYYR